MKKKYAFILTAALGLFVVQEAFTNSGGAPGGSSGSPASNGNGCDRAGCHNGPAASGQAVTISTSIPASGFKEDSVYQITISANNNGTGTDRIGFSASIESSMGHEGTITSTGNRTRKTGNFITHTSSGNSGSGGQNSWTFDWNAGQAPDQTVIYTAVNFTNQNGSTSGDVVVNQSLALNKNLGIGEEEQNLQTFAVYPNPASDQLNIAGSADLEAPFSLLSIEGKVYEVDYLKTADQHWRADLSALPAGLYLLRDANGKQLRFTKR